MSALDSPSPHLRLNGMDSPYRLPRRVFIGSIVSPQTLLSIRVIKRGVLGVGASGVIRFVQDLDELPVSANGANESWSDEDRSATPVPIPGRAEKAAHSAPGQDEGLGAKDDPPPLPAHSDNAHGDGILSEERKAEERLIQAAVAKHGWSLEDCEVVRLTKDSFLCPGFIDTHIHAPQAPNMGLGQQYELLDWLQYVTFPRERKFEDVIYARKTYESVIQRMINSGTTCAAIYATLHEEATTILADICNEKGLRALVGKCQMDRNSPVDYIERDPSSSMEATKSFVNYCRNLKPYGSPEVEVESASSIGSSSSGLETSSSPEMDSSIARLTATMDEMMDQQAGPDSSASTSSSSNEEAVQSSSASVASSSTRATTHSGSSDRPAKAQPTARHASLGSQTDSLGRGAGYNSPQRQKERERERANGLVQPILTPRFAISCSDALLTSISALMSRDPTLRLQTHLSENEGEIEFTKKLFPFASSYTDVYDHFSLLTPRTILAHAIHLDDYEMELLGKRKCGISHCPTSNNNLRSGVSRVGEMLNRGIKVGLGTDVSGGFGLSILTAIREASVVAKVLGFPGQGGKAATKEGEAKAGLLSNGASKPDGGDEKHRTPAVGDHHVRPVETSGSDLNRQRTEVEDYDFCNGPLSIATLFYLATLGGAEVCNLAHRVGSLEVGKEFDALLINTANGCPNLYVEDEDELEERLEKMLFCGDDRNIASVFVRGRIVGGSSPI